MGYKTKAQLIQEIESLSQRLAQTEELLRRLQAEQAHGERLSTMGQMATSLAHEVNQPLAAIATYTQACARLVRAGKTDPAELLPALDQVALQAEHAGQVIRRLRHFVARGEPHRSTVHINDVVREAVLLSEPELRLGQVRLRTKLAERLPAVLVDRIQIEQVLLNLVRNAVEAMHTTPPEQRELTITTGLTDNAEVEVTVSDTGVGLTVEMVQRLFQMFQTTKPQGLGMGLAISRAILQAHQGRLWVKPNPERGTTFFFALPTLPGTGDHGATTVRRSGR